MGGYGSGRRSGKHTTSGMLALDIRRLHRDGLLVPGHSFNWQWSRNGQCVASINIAAQADHVTLSYCSSSGEGYMEYSVPLTWTACHLGGQRVWFLCPRCGRRVGILYGGKTFACRHCHQLVYASQREGAFHRALRRARKIQVRLGWSGPNGWSKPKGMHWQTFERLKLEHGHHDRRSLLAIEEKFGCPPHRLMAFSSAFLVCG